MKKSKNKKFFNFQIFFLSKNTQINHLILHQSLSHHFFTLSLSLSLSLNNTFPKNSLIFFETIR